MEAASDVEVFCKLAEWFTGFGLEYLSEKGSVRLYYPDFMARVRVESTTTMWIIERKAAKTGTARSRAKMPTLNGGASKLQKKQAINGDMPSYLTSVFTANSRRLLPHWSEHSSPHQDSA
jgi:hypothetical protein